MSRQLPLALPKYKKTPYESFEVDSLVGVRGWPYRGTV